MLQYLAADFQIGHVLNLVFGGQGGWRGWSEVRGHTPLELRVFLLRWGMSLFDWGHTSLEQEAFLLGRGMSPFILSLASCKFDNIFTVIENVRFNAFFMNVYIFWCVPEHGGCFNSKAVF